jgi:hypothetical protein
MQARALTRSKTWPATCSDPPMSESPADIHGKPEASRALVPLTREEGGRSGRSRPLATFVTQMLACRESLPDFRLHRRAASPDAAARYGTAPARLPPSSVERVL